MTNIGIGLRHLSLLLPLALLGQTRYNIQTIAGTGKLPVPPDGITSSELRLVQPTAVSSDGAGSLYILDLYLQAVLKIGPDGVVTRFAGTGEDGFSGDDGPATEARFRNPTAILATPSGELYVSDSSNGRIRKVAADGTITTIAGTGALARSGDGGPAKSAAIGNPRGLVLDSEGNLYFSDSFNHVVRRIAAADQVITTVAGSGQLGFAGDGGAATSARLQTPLGLAIDATGNLFIADSQNQRIRRVDAATGVITTFAGSGQTGFNGDNGPAANAWLFAPSDVLIDPDTQDLYIADTSNGRLRKVGAGAGVITTIAGGGPNGSTDEGPAIRASLGALNGLTMDGNHNLITAEVSNKRLRSIHIESGTIRLIAGIPWTESPGDGLPAADGGILLVPVGVGVDASGQVFIADQLDHRVRAVDPATGVISTLAGNGTPTSAGDGGAAVAAGVAQPSGIAVDSLGHVYVSTPTRIRRIRPLAEGGGITTYAGSATTGFAGDEGPANAARISFPQGMAFDAEDNLYIADTSNHRIRKISRSTGIITTIAGNGTAAFAGDNGPALRASLSSPRGVAVDTSGNVYIADSNNHRIRKVDITTGIITTIAGAGVLGAGPDAVAATESRLNTPVGIVVDASGNILIGHGGSGQIRRIDGETGIISTIAGTATLGFLGDGGPAIQARLNFPAQLVVGADGRIYLADRMNYRVRVLTAEED